MLTTEDLRVEVSVVFGGYSPCIRLATNLHPLVVGEVNVLHEGVGIKGIQVKSGE